MWSETARAPATQRDVKMNLKMMLIVKVKAPHDFADSEFRVVIGVQRDFTTL